MLHINAITFELLNTFRQKLVVVDKGPKVSVRQNVCCEGEILLDSYNTALLILYVPPTLVVTRGFNPRVLSRLGFPP